mmetsp:Transcript_182/g.306  ORF Transcript_182/g.306 Transcript_182/m.306 type:complete len:169 (+) Transcript_182:123-629(+)
MAALVGTNERQEQEASEVVHRTLGVTFVRTLGEGAEGAVYLAKDPKTGRLTAVKRIKKKMTMAEAMSFPELACLKRLKRHPGVVQLTHLVRDNPTGCVFMQFEYMATDLAKLLSKPPEALSELGDFGSWYANAMHQLTDATAHIHRSGYFHRDIKPENILSSENGARI